MVQFEQDQKCLSLSSRLADNFLGHAEKRQDLVIDSPRTLSQNKHCMVLIGERQIIFGSCLNCDMNSARQLKCIISS